MRNIAVIIVLLVSFLIGMPHEAEASNQGQLIIINKSNNQLAFYDNGKLVRTFSVGTGRDNAFTPEGTFKIVNKIKNRPYYSGNIPGGDPRNPLGDRWLGLDARGTYGTTYAIHGNNNPASIGNYVSAGCVRMHNHEVRWLFDQVKLNTTVIITNTNNTFEQIARSRGYQITQGQAINKTITVLERTHLYNQPNTSSRTSAVLNPQSVRATEKLSNWYKINTWMGPRWIPSNNTIDGTIKNISQKLTLTENARLHNQPIANTRRSEVLRPQMVQATGEWNGWYRVNTWLGSKWIKPSNVIVGEIKSISQKITLTQNTYLHNQPFTNTRRSELLRPQTVQATGEWNGWYRINTWVGPKWIKPSNAIVGEIKQISQIITLTQNTYLHNQPFDNTRRSDLLRPQTVQATGEWNGWYRINTWVGPKWIKPANAIVGEIKQISQSITLTQNTHLHNQPFANTRRSEVLGPQTVQATGEWNGWYRINTWVGSKWIQPTNAIVGEIKSISQSITLTQNTHLHNQPFANTRRSEVLGPQTVQATGEWNGWYRVNTWLGSKWIQPTNAIVGEIKSISQSITLTQNTYLHNHPFANTRRSEVLQPQTVHAIGEWNGWYQINTWIGPKWIKVN
ncbi:L,D-transpeptidase [Alkalihalobacterium alkalinitrilicum]|uniref:L,D-transpeptidase n=1 Tax=Alkalihalobacterium alkalinitrilicum TaxID=427920 RepID=UPI000994A9A7|nr:L,D-transpeptidase [Alkalihalobacterium alkalinitrilicum]